VLFFTDSNRPRPWHRNSAKDFEKIKEIQRLGKGSFGVVTLVEDPETRQRVALRSIEMEASSDGQKIVSDFMKEVDELIRLIHPCVLEIVGYSLPMDDHPAKTSMRFASNGSLKDVIEH
jgi:serine/threonine protein kinase